MSVTMDDIIKRWTAKRKTALVVELIQGKTTVAEASRAYVLSPSEIEAWASSTRHAPSVTGSAPTTLDAHSRRWT